MSMNEEIYPVIEIRDPLLDGQAIARQVQQQVVQRRAEGNYDLDLETVGSELLRPGRIENITDTPVGFPGLREDLAELMARGYLQEPDFTSTLPIIGSLVVAARRLWNWMSTKWYVRPIMWQQSDLNERSARVIGGLAQWHELDARRLGQLEARVAELEARLARLESETEA